jgi:hypothetical protein
MKRGFVCLFLLVSLFAALQADEYIVSRQWAQTYAAQYGYANFYWHCQTSDGGYIAVGELNYNGQHPDPDAESGDHVFVVKTAADGSESWRKIIEIENVGETACFVDEISGGFLVGVNCTYYGSTTGGQLLFLDESGTLLNRVGVPIKLYRMSTMGANSYLISGRSGGDNGSICKITIDPVAHSYTQNWSYASTDDWGIYEACVMSDGSVVGVGTDVSDLQMVKLTASGAQVWEHTYDSDAFGNNYSREATSIVEGNDGNYWITGQTGSYAFIAAVAPDGSWVGHSTSTGSDSYGNKIIKTSDGDFLIAGARERYYGSSERYFVYLAKFDSSFNKLWDWSTYSVSDIKGVGSRCVLQNSDGDYVVAGVYSPNGFLADGSGYLDLVKDGIDHAIVINDAVPFIPEWPNNVFTMSATETMRFSIDAYDPDGHALNFSWNAWYNEGGGWDGREDFYSTESYLDFTPPADQIGLWCVYVEINDLVTRSSNYLYWDVQVVEVNTGTVSNTGAPMGFAFNGGSGAGGNSLNIIPPASGGSIDVTQFNLAPITLPEGGDPFDLYYHIDGTKYTGGFPVEVTISWDAPAPTGTDNPCLLVSLDGSSWLDVTNDPGVNVSSWQLNSAPYSVSFTTDHFSYWAMGNNMEGALPVTLTAFSAVQSGQDAISIDWTVESESGIVGYELMRSQAADEAGEVVSGLIAADNTPFTHSYRWQDTEFAANTHYWYWLESINVDGSTTQWGPVDVVTQGNATPHLPQVTSISANYPNPFNPQTTIQLSVKEAETATFIIFDAKGRQVLKKSYNAGEHTFVWDAADQASGVYFYRLTSPSIAVSRKMVLMK